MSQMDYPDYQFFYTCKDCDETGTITRIIGPKEIKVKEHAAQILG